MDLLTSNLDDFIRADKEIELYGHIVSRVKAMLADAFGSRPTNYHDGERRIIVDVANEIYSTVSVTKKEPQKESK